MNAFSCFMQPLAATTVMPGDLPSLTPALHTGRR